MPGMTEEKRALDSSLRNSGNLPGSPAYDHAMAQEDARQANAQTQAEGAAVATGNQIQGTNYGESANTNQQLFGQSAQQTAANNSGISQALSAWAEKTGIPLNQLQAMLGSSTVSMPGGNASPASATSTPDIMSAFQNAYNGQLNNYNAQTQSNNAMMGDAAGLGAAALMAFSDRRAKKDIRRVGETPEMDLPVYRFRYKWEDEDAPKHTGVMAQDVEEVDPSAVFQHYSGLKMVDYAKVA